MHDEPIYLKIKKHLIYLISMNQHRPLFKLPSEKQLSIRFKCSRLPATRALNELCEEGLIDRVRGCGSFIKTTDTTQMLYMRKSVCFIIPLFDSGFNRALLTGVSMECQRNNINLFCLFTRNVRLSEEQVVDSALGKMFDGLILFPANQDRLNNRLHTLISKKFPLLFVARKLYSLMPHSTESSVCCDDFLLITNAMKFIFKQGHKKIAFISEESETHDAYRNRISAYSQFIDQNHLENHLCEIDFYSSDSSEDLKEHIVESLNGLFDKNSDVTAIICTDLVTNYLEKCLVNHGISLENLMLLVIDYPENPQNINIPQTYYIDQNPEEMGRIAAKQMSDQILGNIQPAQIFIKPQIIRLSDDIPVEENEDNTHE